MAKRAGELVHPESNIVTAFEIKKAIKLVFAALEIWLNMQRLRGADGLKRMAGYECIFSELVTGDHGLGTVLAQRDGVLTVADFKIPKGVLNPGLNAVLVPPLSTCWRSDCKGEWHRVQVSWPSRTTRQRFKTHINIGNSLREGPTMTTTR